MDMTMWSCTDMDIGITADGTKWFWRFVCVCCYVFEALAISWWQKYESNHRITWISWCSWLPFYQFMAQCEWKRMTAHLKRCYSMDVDTWPYRNTNVSFKVLVYICMWFCSNIGIFRYIDIGILIIKKCGIMGMLYCLAEFVTQLYSVLHWEERTSCSISIKSSVVSRHPDTCANY